MPSQALRASSPNRGALGMPVGLCWTHKVLCCVNQLGPATEANKISKKFSKKVDERMKMRYTVYC